MLKLTTMLRRTLHSILLLLIVSLLFNANAIAQTEAESSATDITMQSRLGKKDRDIKIGQTGKYCKVGERKFSNRKVFNGMDGDKLIFDTDTLAVNDLRWVRFRDEKSFKTGKNMFWVSLALRILGFVAIAIISLLLFNAYLAGLIIASIILVILAAISVPLFYAAIIIMIAASRTFELKRMWKVVPKEKKPKIKLD